MFEYDYEHMLEIRRRIRKQRECKMEFLFLFMATNATEVAKPAQSATATEAFKATATKIEAISINIIAKC